MPKTLVVDRFRPVERRIGQATSLTGSLLGGAAVILAVRTAHPFWAMLAFAIFSLAVGAAVAAIINLAYRHFFPDGIPESPDSAYISPGYYGRVAWRHFWSFTARLALVVTPCAGWLVIFLALGTWR